MNYKCTLQLESALRHKTWMTTGLRHRKEKWTTPSNDTRHQTAIIYSIPWLETESRAASIQHSNQHHTASQQLTYDQMLIITAMYDMYKHHSTTDTCVEYRLQLSQ